MPPAFLFSSFFDPFRSFSFAFSSLFLCMPSEPHGEGDIAVELWKKLEPGEK